MAIIVADKDGSYAIKKLSPYDMAALEEALFEAGERRRGKYEYDGHGERMNQLSMLVEDAVENKAAGQYITKEK